MTILLEEGIDAGNATILTNIQIFRCQATILSIRLLALHRVLQPNTRRVEELSLPWLQVASDTSWE
jgi:hypothetical protein